MHFGKIKAALYAQGRFILIFDFADIGTQLGQLPDQMLIATLDEVDMFHISNTFRCKTRNHQGCTGTEIMGTDRRSMKLFHTGNRCCLAADLDFGTHVFQFGAIAS